MPRIHLPLVSRTHSANRVRSSKNAVFDRAESFLVHKKCAELSAHFFVSLWEEQSHINDVDTPFCPHFYFYSDIP